MRADKIKNESVKWLWKERIPVGAITLIAGRPGGAKSLLGVRIASDISKQGTVILSMTEDTRNTMLGPRLTAVGANKKRIIIDEEPLFPEDMERIRKIIELRKVKLMICDPINEHLSQGVSRYNDSVRKATKPLKRLAEETGCAIILIDHVLKNVAKNAHPMAAVGGASSGLSASARMVYIVGRDPEDRDRVLMCNIKTALRDDPEPYEFTMDEADVEGLDKPMSLLIDEGEQPGYDVMHLLDKPGKGGKLGRPPTKMEAAMEFLAEYLNAAPRHEAKASEITEDAKHYKITKRTLEGAKSQLEIESVKRQNEWWWVAPPELIEAFDEGS